MTEIVSYNQKLENVRQWLEKSKVQIGRALPEHITKPERMARVVFTAIMRTPRLADCTIPSLIGAVIQSAQLGLLPDGVLGHAFLIPYKNNKKNCHEVQFQIGYKGLIELARRSGQLSTIYARVVCEKDKFAYSYGLDEKCQHEPFGGGDRGALTYVYGVAKLRDGGVQFEVMSRDDIDKVRKRSRTANDGPWVTDYEAMAQKTVLKRICKLLPSSTEKELATTVSLDDMAEADLPQDLGVIFDLEEKEQAQDPLEALLTKHKETK